MRKNLLPLFVILFFASSSARAQEITPLPFAVSLGGQVATHKAGEAFAKVAKPVKSDAAIEIESKDAANGGMVIINVNKVDDKGEAVPDAQPAVIILQGTTKGGLDATMDKQKLAPGKYLFSVVADGNTASIMIAVE